MAAPDRDTVYTTDGTTNRTTYTRESSATGWFVGIIVALALLAIGYLVFSANSTPSTTTTVNNTPAVTAPSTGTDTAPMTQAPATGTEAAPMTEAPAAPANAAPAAPADTAPAAPADSTAPATETPAPAPATPAQ
ncbi:MAG: hypothetical protein ACTHLT_18690 [Devosia sp.]